MHLKKYTVFLNWKSVKISKNHSIQYSDLIVFLNIYSVFAIPKSLYYQRLAKEKPANGR